MSGKLVTVIGHSLSRFIIDIMVYGNV